MTSAYTRHITIAVPESLIDEANHLACLIGESAKDINTFSITQKAEFLGGPLLGPELVDSTGVAYAVVSLRVTDALFAMLDAKTLPPTPPHADGIVDRDKAQTALEAIWKPNGILLLVDVPHAKVSEYLA